MPVKSPILFLKAIPSGARWITVFPNGRDNKGRPLLVQEEKNGTMRVIGGAGGKLNYLKLKGVRSEAEYKSEAADRAKSKREEKKLKTKRDKENGVYEPKQEARRNVKNQKTEREQGFIQLVSQEMGWKDEDIKFQEDDYKNISEKALDKAREKHHRATLKKANEAVDAQRKQILADSAGRLKDIGEIPLESDDPETVSVQDLDPVHKSTGLGYATDYKERAQGKGLTDDELKAEKGVFQPADDKKRGASAESIGDELKGLREPGPRDADIKLLSTRKSIELMKAQKSLKAIQSQAKTANKDIDRSAEPKAYVLAVGEVGDKDVLNDLQDDLKTVSTRAFLDEVGKTDDYETQLGRHIGVGAYNSVNALSLAATGSALVGRDAVDVLGISAAAQILSRRLNSDMTPDEVTDILHGIESFHVDHYMKASEESLQEARQWQDLAKDIEIDSAMDGHDLAHMQELNAKRRDSIDHAERILGTTLGEMEANAALVMALKQKPKDEIQVSLGKVSVEDAIRRARAIGLERGDYQIERVGANTFMTVQGAGMDRLAKPVSKEDLQQVRRNMDIIDGRKDEDNWLPLGIANRPDLASDVPAGVAPRLAEPFNAGDNLEQSVRDYIGGRTADGDPPADILADLQSLDSMEKVGDRSDEYFKVLDGLAPLKDGDGNMIRVESHQKDFEAMADKFVSGRYGQERQPLHKQSIEMNQSSVDALHRALADSPTGTLAYKQVGDLDRKEQGHLRNWFYKNVASKDEGVNDLREQLETLSSSEPEKEVEDMFGVGTNPEWTDWKRRRDDLAEEINGKDLSWSRYSKIMGSPVKAYASIQDQVRSNIAEKFHEIYNKTNPDKPLKIGRTVIAGNLNHLDAVDSVARDQRLSDHRELVDSLRERVGGRYASGAVSDKLDSARESMEAATQSQMGFFAADEINDAEQALKADERHTLGQSVERQIAAMMPMVGKNFRPGKPTNLWQASMNGKYINAQRAIKLIDQNKRVVLAQGVGCVHGSTILNDACGKNLTFYDWWKSGESPVVLAWNGKALVSQQASQVFVKGIEEMFSVEVENGSSILVTANHKFLTRDGWKKTKNLDSNDCIKGVDKAYSPASVPDIERILNESKSSIDNKARLENFIDVHLFACGNLRREFAQAPLESSLEHVPGVHRANARHLLRITQDFLARCYLLPRQYDEQPLLKSNNDLVFSPLLSDARERSRRNSQKGAEDICAKRSRSCQCEPHLSKTRSLIRIASHSFGALSRILLSLSERIRQTLRVPSLPQKCSIVFQHKEGKGHSYLSCEEPKGEKVFFWHLLFQSHKTQNLRIYLALLPLRALSYVFDMLSKLFLSQSLLVQPLKYHKVRRVVSAGSSVVFDVSVTTNHNYLANGMIHHNSGKTVMMLGGFSHLQQQGKVKKGLFVVPSIVQGQFSGESLRYLESGKFNWHIEPGASRESRIASYKDPENHFSVVTHQGFRDDMLHLGAKQAGISEKQLSDQLAKQSPAERKQWMRGVMDKEGINWDYLAVDEGHDLLNRAGKENSILANVVDSLSANSPYYVNASADPVKNDPSEIFDLLHKMEPERYHDQKQFMRRYGVDTAASKDELRRELARYFYPGHIKSGVKSHKKEISVPLSDEQKADMKVVQKNLARARLARIKGEVDIDAMRVLSPHSFDGVDESQLSDIAGRLQRSLGILKHTSVQRVIDNHPKAAKLDEVSRIAGDKKDKPGVIFTRSLDNVKRLAERLKKEGHRVVTITGRDSAKRKEAARLKFRPEKGEAEADILIASDAGAVGLNAQRGQWLVQYDTPDTAKTHAQRAGRIDRLGQKNEVDLIDLVADHPAERKNRKRLAEKYDLRGIMTTPLNGLDDTGVAGYLHRARMEREQKSLL